MLVCLTAKRLYDPKLLKLQGGFAYQLNCEWVPVKPPHFPTLHAEAEMCNVFCAGG